MARNRQNQKQRKHGQHRKETKEEKRSRLKSQEEAREYCEKILPNVGIGIFVFLLLFGIFVRSKSPTVAPKQQQQQQQQRQQESKSQDFSAPKVDEDNPLKGRRIVVEKTRHPKLATEPQNSHIVQEALDEAKEILDNLGDEDESREIGGGEPIDGVGGSGGNNEL